MTVIRTTFSDEVEAALARYRQFHPEDYETIVQKALKRFLLAEGFPAEDEVLNEEEVEALKQYERGDSNYESWRDVKKTL